MKSRAEPVAAVRRIAPYALAAAGLMLAWGVLSLGMADHLATSDPEAALRWRGGHPQALLARAAAEDVDPATAAELARRALRADPLDGTGYRRLAELAAAQDPERALALYTLAAARSPRDSRAHAWLVDHYLRSEEPAAALAHLDALLRLDRSRLAKVMPLMVWMAQSPLMQPVLAERLQAAPPWRGNLLRRLAIDATDVDATGALFDRLRTAPGGLAPAEVGGWLDRLGKEGRWGQAYLIWVSQLPPEQLERLGNVHNGGFEHAPTGTGFGWRFDRVAGARIDRVTDAGGEGRYALRVAFEHRRVPFAHVRQLLVLPPGRYRLEGRARVENLRTELGLVWRLQCVTGTRTLGETRPFRGHAPWRGFQADFEVPEGCDAQWLTLLLPSRNPVEQRIGGQVWFDDIAIRRRPAGE